MIDLKKYIDKAIEYIDIFNNYEFHLSDFTDLCAKTGVSFDYNSPQSRYAEFSFEKCFGPIENYSKKDLVSFKEKLETMSSFNYDSDIRPKIKYPDGKYGDFDVNAKILFEINNELLRRLSESAGFTPQELLNHIDRLRFVSRTK